MRAVKERFRQRVVEALLEAAEGKALAGRLDRAEDLYSRSLGMTEQFQGGERKDFARCLRATADFFDRHRQDPGRARSLRARAIAVDEEVCGREHPWVEMQLVRMADLDFVRGQDVEAELGYRRVLAMREARSGTDSRASLRILHNLTRILHRRGRLEEAEAISKRALTIRKRAFGEHHLQVAENLEEIAELADGQGDPMRALRLRQQALLIRAEALGIDHPDVDRALTRLAKSPPESDTLH